MKKASLTIAVLVFITVFSTTFAVMPGNVKATTFYVGGIDPGNYTTIQSAIDVADSGDTIFVYGGSYYERIRITKTLSLIGENKDMTTIDGEGIGDVIYVSADWVNISGFTVRNAGLNWDHDEGDAGIELYYAENCTIGNNAVSLNNRTGIYLSDSNSNTIADNTISNNLFGIYLRSSDGNAIADNYASENHIAIQVEDSAYNTITANTMVENGIHMRGLLRQWNTHTIDTSNTVNGKPVYYWKNVVGGRIPSGAGQVILANCSGVIVENQNVSNGSVGVELGFSSYNTIINNVVSSNRYSGIYLTHSSYNSIGQNVASSSLIRGIFLHSHDNNNTIYNNNISNGDLGIFLDDSGGSIVVGNRLSRNEIGIALYRSYNSTIANNTVSSSIWHGFVVESSDNNRIYHNNIIDNAQQAWDNTDTNQWDDGYPSGGNYWSDYTGPDLFSGPDQNLPGSDGMGDIPYIIDADSRDRYPLVSTYGIVEPRPPVMLDATLSGGDFENVTLIWSLSPDDGIGYKSAVGYEIYRSVTFDSNGTGYGQIATVPNGTSTFVDAFAGEGDPNNYFYIVCAVDIYDSTACSENQAAKFTRPLSQGPNLVSIPLIQSNESIETVLQTVKYDKAWFYDSSSQEWKWHMTSKEYRRGLWNVDHIMGLWVNVTDVYSLTVAGVVPSETAIELFNGWNLVSFPSFKTSYTVADLRVETGATRVEGVETMPPFPPYRLRVLGDMDVLQVGHGYWVRVDADTIWTIEVS